MTKLRIVAATVIAVFVMFMLASIVIIRTQHKAIRQLDDMLHEQYQVVDSLIQTKYVSEQEWCDMITAIAWQESRWQDDAQGSGNDVGYLQITPIYVAEANRIIGYEHFTLDDRYDRQKSIDMFNTVQAYYNPTRDLHLALKIHNPGAPLYYHKQIMNKYKELQAKQ
jgi:hypothetical protein